MKGMCSSIFGFEYEKNVAKILQKLDPAWVSSLFIPAGAGSDKPDLELLLNRYKDYGCELKDEGRISWIFSDT